LGRSQSTFRNYSFHVATISLHFRKIPTELDPEQVHDYLFFLQKSQNHLHNRISSTLLFEFASTPALHPHLPCIVPGGGVDKNAQWKNSQVDGKFLFPVKALSKVFRAKYCEKLKAKTPIGYEQI
jgi:hypothetical protein